MDNQLFIKFLSTCDPVGSSQSLMQEKNLAVNTSLKAVPMPSYLATCTNSPNKAIVFIAKEKKINTA